MAAIPWFQGTQFNSFQFQFIQTLCSSLLDLSTFFFIENLMWFLHKTGLQLQKYDHKWSDHFSNDVEMKLKTIHQNAVNLRNPLFRHFIYYSNRVTFPVTDMSKVFGAGDGDQLSIRRRRPTRKVPLATASWGKQQVQPGISMKHEIKHQIPTQSKQISTKWIPSTSFLTINPWNILFDLFVHYMTLKIASRFPYHAMIPHP